MKENKEGMLKGTFVLMVSTLIVKFLGVVFKIPLASFLGEEGMGYFNSAYTVFSFFYLICTAGVPKAIMILESRENKKTEANQDRIKIALWCFGLFGFITSVILFLLSPLFAKLVGSDLSKFTLAVIAPSIFFVAMGGVLRGKLTAELNLISISISQLVEAVGRLLLGLYFAKLGIKASLPLPIISALTVLGVTVGSIFGFVYLYICYKTKKRKLIIRQKERIRLSNIKTTIKDILTISLPITASATVMSLGGIIDLSIVIRSLRSIGYSEIEATALYGNYTTLAIPMLNLAVALITPISVAYVPIFSKLFGDKDHSKLKNTVNESIQTVSLVSIPLTLGLYTYSEQILRLLFPTANIAVGASLLRILCPSIFLTGILLVLNSVLESTGNQKAPIISMLLGSVVKIVSCLILIKSKGINLSAAPIGTSLCNLTALTVSLTVLYKRIGFMPSVISRSLIPLAHSLSAILLTKPLFSSLSSVYSETFSLIVTIASIILVYGILVLFTLFVGKVKNKKMAIYTNLA